MAKINFSKVEKSFDHTLQQLLIEHLTDLGAVANMADSEKPLSKSTIEATVLRFQRELKKLKKHDSKLYLELHLSKETEERFLLPHQELTQADWIALKELKMKIDELKHTLYGEENKQEEFENQVVKERRKHINKRFNIRDGWLPLR